MVGLLDGWCAYELVESLGLAPRMRRWHVGFKQRIACADPELALIPSRPEVTHSQAREAV